MTEKRQRYTVFVTYDYVEQYDVEASSPAEARLAWERGDAEHADTHPPVRRRVSVKETSAPDNTARVMT